MTWFIRNDIAPAFNEPLTKMKYVSGGLTVVKTKEQRNQILPPFRKLGNEENTLVAVKDLKKIYVLVNEPGTDITTDSDWEEFLDVSNPLTPIGDWQADNTTPVLSDAGADGLNGQFYFVTGAPSGVAFQDPSLFDGQLVTVYDGDWVMSVGDKWTHVRISTGWDSLNRPQSIIDYENGIVQAHSHVINDVSGLQTALDNKFDSSNVADDSVDFSTVPGGALADKDFLTTHYYRSTEVYTQTEVDNLLGAGSFTSLSDTPSDFTGSSEFLVRVNNAANALEFVNATSLFAAAGHTHVKTDITDFADTDYIQTGANSTLTGNIEISGAGVITFLNTAISLRNTTPFNLLQSDNLTAGVIAGVTTDTGFIEVYDGANHVFSLRNNQQSWINTVGGFGIGTDNPDPNAAAHFGGTGAIIIPVGTNVRPAPATGMLRFNSDLANAEIYDGGSWISLGAGIPSTNFLALSDTPTTYVGSEGYLVKVSDTGTVIEFVDPSTIGGGSPAGDNLGDVQYRNVDGTAFEADPLFNWNSGTSTLNAENIVVGANVIRGGLDTFHLIATGQNLLIGHEIEGVVFTESQEGNLIMGLSPAFNANVREGNIIAGYWAARDATIGDSNIIMGTLAGDNIAGTTSTDFNIIMGTLAAQNAGDINRSIVIGPETGKNMGDTFAIGDNTAVGRWALNDSQANSNSGFGAYAGYNSTIQLTGINNTFLGRDASYSVGTVANTVAIGYDATVGASDSIAIGNTSRTISQYDIVQGFNAGNGITGTGLGNTEANIWLGFQAMRDTVINTNEGFSQYITAIGYNVANAATFVDGYATILMGEGAGSNSTMIEDYEIFIGSGAGESGHYGRGNIGIGTFAMQQSIGGIAGNNAGFAYNIGIGLESMKRRGASIRTVGLGNWAGGSSIQGDHTGDYSIFIGDFSGYQTVPVDIDRSIVIGSRAGIGTGGNTTVEGITVIGAPWGTSSLQGYRPDITANNQMWIGSVGDIRLQTDYNGTPQTFHFTTDGNIEDGSGQGLFWKNGDTTTLSADSFIISNNHNIIFDLDASQTQGPNDPGLGVDNFFIGSNNVLPSAGDPDVYHNIIMGEDNTLTTVQNLFVNNYINGLGIDMQVVGNFYFNHIIGSGHVINTGNVSTQYNFVGGRFNELTGAAFNSIAFGYQTRIGDNGSGFAIGVATGAEFLAAGRNSHNLSGTRNTGNTDQTLGHGAFGLHSFIGGGVNHNIPDVSNDFAAIIGGEAIKAADNASHTVYMPKVRIGQGFNGALPTTGQTNGIGIDSATGELIQTADTWKTTGTTTLTGEAIIDAGGNDITFRSDNSGTFTIGDSIFGFPDPTLSVFSNITLRAATTISIQETTIGQSITLGSTGFTVQADEWALQSDNLTVRSLEVASATIGNKGTFQVLASGDSNAKSMTFLVGSLSGGTDNMEMYMRADGIAEFRFSDDGAGQNVIFTDSRAIGTKAGIEYAADYSTDAGFGDRSLIDKGYADATYWALTGTSTLTGNTTIDAGTNTLKLQQSVGVPLHNIQLDFDGNFANEIDLAYYVSTTRQTGLRIGSGSAILGSTTTFLTQDSGGFTATIGGSGTFEYATDYSTNYVDRSLIDKGFADGAYWGATAGTTTLATGEVHIQAPTGGADLLTIGRRHATGSSDDAWLEVNTGLGSSIQLVQGDWRNTSDYDAIFISQANGSSFEHSTASGSMSLTLTDTSFLISDSINSRGLEYSTDYSAGFTARSLIDKGYADSTYLTAETLLNNATGDERGIDYALTVNKATSGAYSAFVMNVTETSVHGSDNYLMDLRVGGTRRWTINTSVSNSTKMAQLYKDSPTTNSVVELLTLAAYNTVNNPSVGFGAQLTFELDDPTGSTPFSNRMQVLYTNVGSGTEETEYVFTSITGGAGSNLLRIGRGVDTTTKIIPQNGELELGGSNGATRFSSYDIDLGVAASGATDRILEAYGSQTNIDISLKPKGSGSLNLGVSGSSLGFFGVTGVTRQTTSSQTPATFAANTSGISDDTATWNGYTIGDLVAILQAYGLLT